MIVPTYHCRVRPEGRVAKSTKRGSLSKTVGASILYRRMVPPHFTIKYGFEKDYHEILNERAVEKGDKKDVSACYILI